MYIFNAPIASTIIRELNTYLIPSAEATWANNLFLNLDPLSDKMCKLPNLEYTLIKQMYTISSASFVCHGTHYV